MEFTIESLTFIVPEGIGILVPVVSPGQAVGVGWRCQQLGVAACIAVGGAEGKEGESLADLRSILSALLGTSLEICPALPGESKARLSSIIPATTDE